MKLQHITLMITSTEIISNDTYISGAYNDESKIIIDSKLSLKRRKMLLLNTMKVKLLCMDTLSSKNTHGWFSEGSDELLG